MGQACTVNDDGATAADEYRPPVRVDLMQRGDDGESEEGDPFGDEEVVAEGFSLLHRVDTHVPWKLISLPVGGGSAPSGRGAYFSERRGGAPAATEADADGPGGAGQTGAGEMPLDGEEVPVLQPTITLHDGATYTGHWLGGMRHGLGRQRWPDGASFEGTWAEGLPRGPGRFVHPGGSLYVGEFAAGLAHGLGTSYSSGGRYTGAWCEDQPEGLGIVEWGSGYRYEGYFAGGRREGHGVYHLADQSSVAGSWWRDGKGCDAEVVGLGELCRGLGVVHEGRWRGVAHCDALLNGPGKYQWEDGQVYEGQFSSGTPSGFGSHEWTDGRHYEGYWREGRPHGFGWYQDSSNGVYKPSLWSFGSMRPESAVKDALNTTKNKPRPLLEGCSADVICTAFPR